jgi:hypothetical protein
VRRRRSAVRTPAFVDRMELAEDAEDRVAIFGVEGGMPQAAEAQSKGPLGEHADGMSRRLGAALDSRYAPLVFAAVLVVILVLGMLLKR